MAANRRDGALNCAPAGAGTTDAEFDGVMARAASTRASSEGLALNCAPVKRGMQRDLAFDGVLEQGRRGGTTSPEAGRQ